MFLVMGSVGFCPCPPWPLTSKNAEVSAKKSKSVGAASSVNTAMVWERLFCLQSKIRFFLWVNGQGLLSKGFRQGIARVKHKKGSSRVRACRLQFKFRALRVQSLGRNTALLRVWHCGRSQSTFSGAIDQV